MNRQFLVAFSLILFTAPLQGEEPLALQELRTRYKTSPPPLEADRQRYVADLAALRARIAREDKNMDWQAVDAEIRRHPAPKDADSKALSAMLVGKWASPRHEYVFRSDGTWRMLPDSPDTTNGRWRITGNQYLSWDDPKQTSRYTIILLNQQHFIFTDGQVVFYETRLPK